MNDSIYCPGCGEIQPLLTDLMMGTDVSGNFDEPTDLICGKCRLVIATTFSSRVRHGPQPDGEKK